MSGLIGPLAVGMSPAIRRGGLRVRPGLLQCWLTLGLVGYDGLTGKEPMMATTYSDEFKADAEALVRNGMTWAAGQAGSGHLEVGVEQVGAGCRACRAWPVGHA